MVETKIMQYHTVPITLLDLPWNVPRHIVINFCEVLRIDFSVSIATIHLYCDAPLTETKKLEVPSARANVPGNNFNQVSSPYMTNFPPSRPFSCESQVS